MSSLGVGITAAVNAKSLFMIFFIICRQCLFSLPIYFEPECCSCTLWRSTQETCMACEYVWGHHVLWGCVGLPWVLWGCVELWIVCEDCGACEDNHSLPTNAFAMVSTQRANTVATNNNDNSHNAKYRCNKILNQTDFFKNRSCFTKWGMNDDEVSMKVSELQVLASYFAPPDVYGLPK